MKNIERNGMLGLAIFGAAESPPIILGEDEMTYAWHLAHPVETGATWPMINRTKEGLNVEGAVPFSARCETSGTAPYREGDVLRVNDRLGVVVRIYFPRSSRFMVRLFGFWTASAKVTKQVLLAALAGASGTSTLILGPTGTGKECIARVIHGARSRVRSSAPFVAMNLGGLSRELCASELFGHERGSFTGAERNTQGAFRAAGRGVLFLDELGEAPEEVQSTLLRTLDSGEVRPVGRSGTLRVEALVVAATNREPQRGGSISGIRFDLIQRLAGLVIRLPALSERVDDVLPLAEVFMSENAHLGGGVSRLSTGAKVLLCEHPWHGNVRELHAALTRAALLSVGEVIDEASIAHVLNIWSQPPPQSVHEDLSHLDREVLRIAKMRPRQRGVERRRLGIAKTTFYRRLRSLNEERCSA